MIKKTLAADTTTISRKILTLDPWTIKMFLAFGEGNMSLGARKAARAAERAMNKTQKRALISALKAKRRKK